MCVYFGLSDSVLTVVVQSNVKQHTCVFPFSVEVASSPSEDDISLVCCIEVNGTLVDIVI